LLLVFFFVKTPKIGFRLLAGSKWQVANSADLSGDRRLLIVVLPDG
jgi:hypothetical protein